MASSIISNSQFFKAKEECILRDNDMKDRKEGNTRRDLKRHLGTKYQPID